MAAKSKKRHGDMFTQGFISKEMPGNDVGYDTFYVTALRHQSNIEAWAKTASWREIWQRVAKAGSLDSAFTSAKRSAAC